LTAVVAAPEIYSAGGRSGCLVSQTYDIWALGCIFFEASIWMTLGREGLDSFRRGKQRIAKHLPGLRQAKVSMEATQYFDAFHDGKDVSSEVKDWQLRLRNSISYTDTLTEKVVGLVDEMLVSDPQQRVTSVELCEKVQNILEREHSKHSLFSNSDIGTSNSLHMLTTSHPARALVKSLSVVLEPSTSVESVGTTTNHQYRDQLENFPSPLEISTRDNFQESCYRLGSQEIANMPKGGQRSPTIKAFLNFLQDYATDGTCGTRNARFIPAMPLKDYLRRNIEDLLRAVSLPNDVHLHRAHDIVESYSQVFAILVSINEGAYIYHFAKKDELSDRRLPFENQKAFPRREDFFDKFYQAQWQFCAPTLTYLFDRSFGKDCILPFKRDGDPIFGDSCSVYRINILPEYDSLCSPDMLDQVHGGSPPS